MIPELRAQINAMAKRDDAYHRARTELKYARRHREAGERKLTAMCLDFAADSREELTDLLAAQTMARQIGLDEHKPEE